MRLKVENWNGKRVFVVRDNKGRIESRLKYAGSKLTKEQAKQRFKENNTLKKGVKKTINKLSNFTEISELRKSSEKGRLTRKTGRVPKAEIIQYMVSGYYKKQRIDARSKKISSYLKNQRQTAKKEAWNNFLKRVHKEILNDGYDSDEGLKLIDKIRNIQEGWVYYKKK